MTIEDIIAGAAAAGVYTGSYTVEETSHGYHVRFRGNAHTSVDVTRLALLGLRALAIEIDHEHHYADDDWGGCECEVDLCLSWSKEPEAVPRMARTAQDYKDAGRLVTYKGGVWEVVDASFTRVRILNAATGEERSVSPWSLDYVHE